MIKYKDVKELGFNQVITQEQPDQTTGQKTIVMSKIIGAYHCVWNSESLDIEVNDIRVNHSRWFSNFEEFEYFFNQNKN